MGILEHDWFPVALPSNVTIGPRSWCHSSYAFRYFRSRKASGLTVGHDTGLYHGTDFDVGEAGEVEIGNYCTIAGATFSTNARIVVGDYALVSYHVVLADSFDEVPLEHQRPASDETVITIGENCWVGARAVLLAGAKIGDNAIVGAGTVIDFEVPPGTMVAGNPARIVSR